MELQEVRWQEFHLYDLFIIDTGNKFDKSKMTSYAPSVNFVGRSSSCNGVTDYVDIIEGVQPYAAGNLTVALGGEYLGSCFIQDHPFYTSQNVAVLIPLEKMSDNVKLFISHLIRNESKNNYMAFARELNAHIKTDFVIQLPVTQENVPDYQFMDDFISSLECDISKVPEYFLNEGYDKAYWYIDNIDQERFENEYAGTKEGSKLTLSDKRWALFRLKSITSSIKSGKAYNSSELIASTDGDDYVSYVTRTDKNNGISMFVQALDYPGLEEANAITIGDTTATAFFQEHAFITGPHIIVVRADWLNVYTASFIITLLNMEKFRYPVFGRAFTKDLIEDTQLYLPVGEDGQPDYNYMEAFIKSLPFSQKM